MASDDFDEPHIKRKLVMIQKYPEIKELFGTNSWTKYIALLACAVQVSLAYYFGRVNTDSNLLFLATVYIVGGSITQICGTIIHECAHALASKSQLVNRFVGLTANIPIPFPIAASFRRYHLEHHAFQGVWDKDPDLPLSWEIYFIQGNPFMKFLFLLFYPFMYVIRGAAMQKTPSNWELINIVWTVCTDTIVYKVCGGRGLLYLFLSLWFGYGIHPMAAHFIQEHYTFKSGQETYSYYGSFNIIGMNIGYHNEHHDFTKISWQNLPKLRELASEFYDPLYHFDSWWKVLFDFVLDPNMGPISRVGRTYDDHKAGRRTKIVYPVDMQRVDSGVLAGEEEERWLNSNNMEVDQHYPVSSK